MELNEKLARNVETLPMKAMDVIPEPNADAKKITGLVKTKGRTVGYQLEDKRLITKEEGVALAKQGGIRGVGVAHRQGTEYLKSLPDGEEGNNLSSLPTVSPQIVNH